MHAYLRKSVWFLTERLRSTPGMPISRVFFFMRARQSGIRLIATGRMHEGIPKTQCMAWRGGFRSYGIMDRENASQQDGASSFFVDNPMDYLYNRNNNRIVGRTHMNRMTDT